MSVAGAPTERTRGARAKEPLLSEASPRPLSAPSRAGVALPLLAPLIAACSASPATAAGAPVEVFVAQPTGITGRTAPSEGDPSEPVMIPVIVAAPAPWLETPAQGPLDDNPLGDPVLTNYGAQAAILTSAAGSFAVHDKHGVIGPLLVPPGTADVLLGGPNDAVYAAAKDGSLQRAKDLSTAGRPGGFEARAGVPGATIWEASGGFIAAARGAAVHVSTDEGRSFRASVPAAGRPVVDVLVRHDGVIAALVEMPAKSSKNKKATAAEESPRRLFLSRDEGRTWQPSAFQPREVYREGAWIWNGEERCPAVLSKDGRQWTTSADIGLIEARYRWMDSMILYPFVRARPASRSVTSFEPPAPDAPAPGRAATGAERGCRDPNDHGASIGSVIGVLNGGGGGSGSGGTCKGATCLRGTHGDEPPTPRTRYFIFGDATCAAKDADRDGECRPGAPLIRPPTFAIIDQMDGTVTTAPSPAGCRRPVHVLSAGGVGVLLCQERDGSSIFTKRAGSAWQPEGTLPIKPELLTHLSMAGDGTLLLEPGSSMGGMRMLPNAFVRSPKPLGQASAWRPLQSADAVAFRVLAGGAVLVAAAPGTSAGKLLDLSVVRDGEPPLDLVRGVEIDQNLLELHIEDGRVVVLAHPTLKNTSSVPLQGKKPGSPAKFFVTRGGRLAPSDEK